MSKLLCSTVVHKNIEWSVLLVTSSTTNKEIFIQNPPWQKQLPLDGSEGDTFCRRASYFNIINHTKTNKDHRRLMRQPDRDHRITVSSIPERFFGTFLFFRVLAACRYEPPCSETLGQGRFETGVNPEKIKTKPRTYQELRRDFKRPLLEPMFIGNRSDEIRERV